MSQDYDGIIESEVIVSEEVAIRGIAANGVTIESGGWLDLYGIVNGQVLIHEGGRAVVYGMINGDIVNEGGNLDIYGVIQGKVLGNGRSTIHPKAVVKGS